MNTKTTDETQVRDLYQAWLDNWNKRDANKLAALCAADCNIVGFDGSQMNSASEVGTTIGKIFADHQTAEYIGIVREVRLLSPEVAALRAVVGMVPRGQSDINPATNTIQTLTAVKQQDKWRIAVFQNTPAAFHGRPELSQQLTEELRKALHASTGEKRS